MSWSAPDGGWSSPPPRFDAQAQNAAYASDQRQIEFVEPNKPPLVWLFLGLALAVAGILLALILDGATIGIISWLIGVLAITATAVFTAADSRQQESGWYAPSAFADWGRRGAILLALVAVTAGAWLIANDVARGVWT